MGVATRKLAISISLAALACARLPAPAGPAILAGAVAAAGQESAIGEAPPDAPMGPLLLLHARVRMGSGALEWSVDVSNPSSERLGVTLVMRIAGAGNTAVAHDSVSFLLSGGDDIAVRDLLELNEQQLGRALSWRLESWVRRLPPPERRTLGTSD